MLLSIIVPVYNVEIFIDSFIKSILSQLTDDCEIIFIDDGSPDKSKNIIKNYIANNERLKLFEQKNQGLSSARNTGISKSRGDFLAFIDPDDLVSPNYINRIINCIKSQNFDILTFNANRIDADGNYLSECTICSPSNNRLDCLKDIFNRGRWYAWARVYRKELFASIQFPVGKRFEDLLTVPELYKLSNSLLSISDILISYRVNPSGITSNPKISDLKDVSDFTNKYMKIIKKSRTIDFDYFLDLSIYLSGVKTLFYISRDVMGGRNSFLYLIKYIKFNLAIRFGNITFLNRNNKVFLKFIPAYYLYYSLFKK
ncbi:glycosyltransferase [Rosenbergiella collisarenosi]|uniref:glycosyltransferase family 2 protein n=1 Tax=Rosenbergiella collisarenosi TaxID=1544695 RepID=UPI001BD913DA|nr:glycosyltransferase [Rosenbergiella collisarenosi]MBT0721213.1 glycosyltransferase [Rosenbergiella collisarenosi]